MDQDDEEKIEIRVQLLIDGKPVNFFSNRERYNLARQYPESMMLLSGLVHSVADVASVLTPSDASFVISWSYNGVQFSADIKANPTHPVLDTEPMPDYSGKPKN